MSTPDEPRVPAEAPAFHFEYSVLKGFFMQSEDSTDDSGFDFKTQNFGLINRSYDTDSKAENEQENPWPRFERYTRHINAAAQDGESIKVLFLGRHGQGWHNVAEAKYGTKAWDCYYSTLPGLSNLVWADAHLTPLGAQQALAAHTLWKTQLPLGLPPPETHYVSPLTRTLQTADLTFTNLPLSIPYTPVVKELLREALGIHTCDQRSTRSQIAGAFPHAVFEPGFAEEDMLWRADYREPVSARRYRVARLLDDVFASDGGVFLSLTAHSGAIASLLEVLGHRGFALETGGVIPVLVRGRRVEGERGVPPWEPSDSGPLCDGPPE
ncbi:phosphoglycerate mutase-like protein [Dothidotthia symphoricarpi CBS 119687]|uniref:Phosphoglycerate mutase-like protein n=1 Tax=Dothidotthia symphoricarpi CBS 119687 TaxID=1392245 RepID=A0A6A6ARB1_9PLEO|nr:phosphoglycerate mutase-like protein [Dothidotthia symphoricarpi CBS 119687]KAF2133753.1 phosphoglycerate mutase-like protein [Dothidotthia symphoricarpi CBS 119687]